MGLFNFFKPKISDGAFVNEQEHQKNLDNQKQMTTQTMEQLRTLQVTEDIELKLEFFFYTNTAEKAKELSHKLSSLNYSVQYGKSAGDKSLFMITGWTTKMPMINEKVVNWTANMCDLGFKCDCDFDGWGTNPEQD